jgi:purine-binding chemotaxis protein CheW
MKMAEIRNLAQVNAELQEKKELAATVDFKMITFSLGGKDYGVDIMSVKEIAKADKFTYVPNASAFVRGVYNLRGDIIPIIDLRRFFHIQADKSLDSQENMLILHIEDRVYGTIVDKLDKVVGLNSDAIQPPHPIFGDVNIKYISGVVEKAGALYVLLDVVRIFSISAQEKAADAVPTAMIMEAAAAPEARPTETDLGFIKEQLAALKKFYPSPINDAWIKKRLDEWSELRSGRDLQLKEASDAEAYLSTFASTYAGRFWSDDYAYAIRAALPDVSTNAINVWNFGCGRGYESYSLACILKLRYPQHRIKIWANDSDIMAIANVPAMAFNADDIPPYCKTFTVSGKNGCTFNQPIKDMIVFEYHDILNANNLPDLDIAVGHDVISYLTVAGQEQVAAELQERLKSGGLVILGNNEALPSSDWAFAGKQGVVSAFKKL